ncbi:hypothetical protein OHB06_49555 [Streptomyces sp. NBC_01604]
MSKEQETRGRLRLKAADPWERLKGEFGPGPRASAFDDESA